ncbi:carbonic anhydrase [Labrys monachus]|uniref:carbonic anhydrase n=1 Tax=Labrys monachus TaxID=217067 RepID=A0ABU0FKA5_9HYPH|nr:carbonic anhydrase [Labrys monachus]MDQ0394485.1 carbonic anhydrase [Labrys monachus]
MCLECTKLSRRSFLSLTATVAAAAGLLAWDGAIRPSFANSTIRPDEALARLKAGNEKFVSAPQLCEAALTANRASVAKGQSPWATILTCADSRVSPELVFGGVGLGELFVARNAGNIVDSDVLGTIEYGAEHLGSPLIVVMGHSRCGAVQAACEVAEKHTVLPGSIKAMVDAIVPAAQSQKGKPGDFVNNVVCENARRNALKISAESEIVTELVHAGKLKVVYARYDLDTGAVDFLG